MEVEDFYTEKHKTLKKMLLGGKIFSYSWVSRTNTVNMVVLLKAVY
jgi:hypothetical protein